MDLCRLLGGRRGSDEGNTYVPLRRTCTAAPGRHLDADNTVPRISMSLTAAYSG